MITLKIQTGCSYQDLMKLFADLGQKELEEKDKAMLSLGNFQFCFIPRPQITIQEVLDLEAKIFEWCEKNNSNGFWQGKHRNYHSFTDFLNQ